MRYACIAKNIEREDTRRLFDSFAGGWGRAERQLVQLVRNLDSASLAITVLTFYFGGALESEMKGLPGVRLETAYKAAAGT